MPREFCHHRITDFVGGGRCPSASISRVASANDHIFADPRSVISAPTLTGPASAAFAASRTCAISSATLDQISWPKLCRKFFDRRLGQGGGDRSQQIGGTRRSARRRLRSSPRSRTEVRRGCQFLLGEDLGNWVPVVETR